MPGSGFACSRARRAHLPPSITQLGAAVVWRPRLNRYVVVFSPAYLPTPTLLGLEPTLVRVTSDGVGDEEGAMGMNAGDAVGKSAAEERRGCVGVIIGSVAAGSAESSRSGKTITNDQMSCVRCFDGACMDVKVEYSDD